MPAFFRGHIDFIHKIIYTEYVKIIYQGGTPRAKKQFLFFCHSKALVQYGDIGFGLCYFPSPDKSPFCGILGVPCGYIGGVRNAFCNFGIYGNLFLCRLRRIQVRFVARRSSDSNYAHRKHILLHILRR